MPPLSEDALRTQIAAGETAPLYMLMGADDEEKSAVAAAFTEMVDEGLRAFNVEYLYGGQCSVDDLVQAAATLPMMSPRRLVIIHHADRLLVPKRESKAAEEELERLEVFLAAAPDHATVVFVCGEIDKRRRVCKTLLRLAHVVECGALETDAAAERWVKARAVKEGVTFDAGAVAALVKRAGGVAGGDEGRRPDIVRLRAGFERVVLYGMGQATIAAADVREAVPAAPDEQRNFGIADAIRAGDAAGALHELGLVLEAGAMPVMVMGQIRWAAEQVAAPRVRAAIDAVFRTDLALKSTGGEPRVLLERLVVELCGPPGGPAAPRGGRGGGARRYQAARPR